MDTTSAFVPNLLSATGAESGFDPLAAKGSRGIYIVPDILFELSLCGPVSLLQTTALGGKRCYLYSLLLLKDKHDLLVIPGGAQGAETMSKHPSVQELVRRYLDKGKLVGMICAGAFNGTLPSKKREFMIFTGSLTALTAKLPSQPITSHPSVRSHLQNGKKKDSETIMLLFIN